MALPADVYDDLLRTSTRLRLVPVDETPPAEAVRQQVQRWQEYVHEAAEAIRRADDIIERFTAFVEPASGEPDKVLAMARLVRAEAFVVMKRLNSDQAWFWTEEWQAGEREAERDLAAGRVTHFASDEEFDAALDALDAEADTL